MIITGGVGFIGSHLAKALPEAYVWDRKIPESLSHTLLGSGTIIHLAASTYLAEGYDRQLIEDNFILPQRLIHAKERIVYASSAAIYKPNNLYAHSKKYLEDLFAEKDAVGLRYYNVYGPGDNGVVGKLINCAKTGKHFVLNGGSQVRDFIYVDDVVRETIKAIDSDKKIIEVGTGKGTTIDVLIKMIQEIMLKRILVYQGKRSPFEQYRSVCPDPISQFTPLYEGLVKTIKG